MSVNSLMHRSRRAILAGALTIFMMLFWVVMPAGATAVSQPVEQQAGSVESAAPGEGESALPEAAVPVNIEKEASSTETELLEKQAALEQSITDLQKQVTALQSRLQESEKKSAKAVVPVWIGVAAGVLALIISLGTMILVIRQPENQSMTKQEVERVIRDAVGKQLANLSAPEAAPSKKTAETVNSGTQE